MSQLCVITQHDVEYSVIVFCYQFLLFFFFLEPINDQCYIFYEINFDF